MGIDGAGALTAVWEMDGPGRGTQIAARPANTRTFGAAQALGPAGSMWPSVEVTESGETLALWREQSSNCGFFGCTSSVHARLGSSGGELGPADRVVDGDSAGDVAAIAEAGHAVVGWQTNPMVGQIKVASRAPGATFGEPEVLTDSPTPGRGGSAPAVAVGSDGSAVVAWQEQQSQTSGTGIVASHRPPGGQFGEPELVYGRIGAADGFAPAAAIGKDGSVAVAWHTDDDRRTMVSLRPRGGSFGTPLALGPGGPPRFSTDASGTQLLSWSSQEATTLPLRFQTYVSVAGPGGTFGAGERVQLAGAQGALLELDELGNVLAAWTPQEDGQRLMATTLTRFGPQEPPQRLTPFATQLTDLAVNRLGAAVAIYTLYPPDYRPGEGRARVGVVERPADESAPALRLRGVTHSRHSISVVAQCDEACRLRGTAAVAGRSQQALGAARRPLLGGKVLHARRARRVRLRLSRSGRARVRRALARQGRARVWVSVQVEDAAGNRRSKRRTLVVRRRR